MKFIVVQHLFEGTPEQEASWKYRRHRRINRYSTLLQHRVAPGMAKGASPAAASKAHKTLGKITRSAAKWNMRGVKRGAGGKIRHEPEYLNRLIKKHKTKTFRIDVNRGSGGWTKK